MKIMVAREEVAEHYTGAFISLAGVILNPLLPLDA